MTSMVNGIFPGEILPSTTVAGCIDIYENVWPSPEQTISMAESEAANPNSGAYWEQAGTVTDGPFQNYRTNKLMGITHLAQVSGNPVLQNIHNQFNMLLLASTIPYGRRMGINEGFWHEHYNLLRYSGGEEYKAHYDGGTHMARAISAVVYLNSDFEGGELEFTHFGVKIKPQPGMLILFPSNYAYSHIAHPVTSGTKYALVTWIRDRHL